MKLAVAAPAADRSDVAEIDGGAAPEAPPVRGGRRIPRTAGVVAGLAVALWFAGKSLPSLPELLQAVARMNVVLAVAAAAVEVASLWLFARQQQVLFAGVGVRVATGSVLAITYSRSAMSMTLPGGAVVSALFAVRQFRRFGATRSTAVTVMVTSGLVSVLGLSAMYAIWLGTSWSVGHPWPAVLVAIAALCVLGAVTTAAQHRPPVRDRSTAATAPTSNRTVRRLASLVQSQLGAVKALPAKVWAASLGLATANWTADFACLLLVSAAFGSRVGVVQLGLLYLGVQLVRQIPLSPGGIGVIEASLVAGLVLIGAAPVTAAAITLVYRFLSCWLVIPVGLVTWLSLSRTPDVIPAR